MASAFHGLKAALGRRWIFGSSKHMTCTLVTDSVLGFFDHVVVLKYNRSHGFFFNGILHICRSEFTCYCPTSAVRLINAPVFVWEKIPAARFQNPVERLELQEMSWTWV